MYQYWAFGLNIHSEIEFPELFPQFSETPDLTIRIGKVPEKLEGDDVVTRARVSASPTEYLLEVPNVVRYYACSGSEIIIEPGVNTDRESSRLFLLSNAIAAILYQRNKIPFHASGILTEKGLVLFTGQSGMGKSTTLYGLKQKGYPVFTDDVCVLDTNKITGQIEAVASYPMIKLWENTIDLMDDKSLAKKYKVRPNLPKYGFFHHDKFIQQSLPISAVYILTTNNKEAEFGCKELDKITAFNHLQINTYRRVQIDMMNLRQSLFQMISQLAIQAKVFQVSRPAESKMIHPFIEFINNNLNSYAKK